MAQDGEKKCFFTKMFAKIDKKMKEKADQSCCGDSSCCPSDDSQNDGEKKKDQGCC